MGNLGAYQALTTIAKKVGGPKNLVGILIGGSIAVGIGVTKGGEYIVKKVRKISKGKLSENASLETEATTFEVSINGKYDSGLEFKIGDKFKALEHDGEVILIEKLGDSNNPYFVPNEFLLKISHDYARRNE